MNNQRKQFIKERRNYEKLLKIKAKLGILSLSEKEQYQNMLYSQRRNRLIRKEKLSGGIITFGIAFIMLVVYYLAPSILKQNILNGKGPVNFKDIQVMNYSTSSRNNIAEKIKVCIDLYNTATEYFNQGIEEYSTTQKVDASYIESLSSLYNNEVIAEFKVLNKLFSYKIDKQIDILTRLRISTEDREQLKKEFEEMIKIDKMFQDEIHEILENEGIAYSSS
ncbi:MAG: hypothetical protein K0S71_2257 [Clostridia bacterium]|jgi:hypothetical protein|nr:hypothetical protein [Clostridia bacterium]